jgi:hypothetical protein
MSADEFGSLTGLPALARVEGLLFVAMNMGTWVPNLSRVDYLDAKETLRSWSNALLGK